MMPHKQCWSGSCHPSTQYKPTQPPTLIQLGLPVCWPISHSIIKPPFSPTKADGFPHNFLITWQVVCSEQCDGHCAPRPHRVLTPHALPLAQCGHCVCVCVCAREREIETVGSSHTVTSRKRLSSSACRCVWESTAGNCHVGYTETVVLSRE